MRLRIAALALAVTAGGALAQPLGSSAALRKDEVTGEGKGPLITTGHGKLKVDAFSSADGSNPGGKVRAQATIVTGQGTEAKVRGKVTCVRIDGHRATIKYRFDKAQGSLAAFEGGGIEVFIDDRGKAKRGRPVDRVGFMSPMPKGVFQLTEDQCDPPSLGAYLDITKGDFTIKDKG